MIELYGKAKEELKKGEPCVLATIIRQTGSSPRGTGAKCLITKGGPIWGSVGGGLLEARTIEEAKKVLTTMTPSKLRFFLTGRDVAETDMICGGHAEVFLEPLGSLDSPRLTALKEAASTKRRGGKGGLVTLLSEKLWEQGEGKWFVKEKGEAKEVLAKELGCVEGVELWWERLVNGRKSEVVKCKDRQGREVEIFFEPIVAAPVVYVFGGGHVSRQIVPLASFVGFRTVVLDDREEFAQAQDFPGAHEVRKVEFANVMEQLPVDEDSYLVIVTRGHIYDKIVLAQALRTNAKYVGMIGSKRKRQMIFQSLLEEGFKEEDLRRVHSPIGLPIGAETPEEIAVSIVAELIKVRAGQDGR